MRINVSEATIKTATVEIKTMSISGKQVTLAVFRQLIDEDVLAFDDDGAATVKGPIWGKIQYHPDASCKKRRNHLHVVWQRGDELRRSAIDMSDLRVPDGRKYILDGEEEGNWLRAAWLGGLRLDWRRDSDGFEVCDVDFGDGLICEVVRLLAIRDADFCGRSDYCRSCRGKEPSCADKIVSEMPESFARLELVQVMRRRRDARRANRQFADALEALPQLFIAV